MDAAVWALAGLLSACVETSNISAPPSGDLGFWLRTRAGVLEGDVLGPFFGDERQSSEPIAVQEGQVLWHLTFELAPLEARFSTDRALLRSSLSLGPSSTRDESEASCESGVRTPVGLEVSLEHTQVAAVRFDARSGGYEAAEPPAGLSLRFQRRACGAERRPHLRHLGPKWDVPECRGSSRPKSCYIADLVSLDRDTVLASTRTGLALFSRSEPPTQLLAYQDLELDYTDLELVKLPPPWEAKDVAVLSSEWPEGPTVLLVAMELQHPRVLHPTGAALLQVTVGPTGAIVGEPRLRFYDRPESDDRRGLAAIHVFPEGAWVAVGTDVVVTATSASAAPVARLEPRFEATVLAPLPESPRRFLAIGNGKQVYEGNLFEPVSNGDVYPLAGAGGVNFRGATTIESSAQLLLAGSDGQTWLRRGPRDWIPQPVYLEEAFADCAAIQTTCGWLRPGSNLRAPVAAGREGDFLVLGIERCNVALVQVGADPCALALALDGAPIESEGDWSLTTGSVADERVILGGYGPAVYELTELD